MADIFAISGFTLPWPTVCPRKVHSSAANNYALGLLHCQFGISEDLSEIAEMLCLGVTEHHCVVDVRGCMVSASR